MLAENPDDVHAGAANLRKQIENVRIHGVSPVVAINAFPTGHPSEHAAIREIAEGMGSRSALCTHFAEGGKGAAELAAAVAEAADESSQFVFLYPHDATLRDKILTVALQVYGAQGVEYDVELGEFGGDLADRAAHAATIAAEAVAVLSGTFLPQPGKLAAGGS